MRLRVFFPILLFLFSCNNAEQVDPIVRTGEVQNIGRTNATFVGRLEDTGAFSTWTFGFIWADFPGANIVSGNLVIIGERSEAGEFSINQEGLNSDTRYFVKAFVSDKSFSSVFYANEIDFTSLNP
jgi:hypothetical protein